MRQLAIRAVRWLPLALIAAAIILARTGLLPPRVALIAAAAVESAILIFGLTWLVAAARRYRRDRAAGLDPWQALEDGLALILPRPIAHLIALEPRLWACLFRWLFRRARPGPDDFPYHRDSPFGAFLVLVLLTTPIEIFLYELLIPWAWLRLILLVASLYAFVWVIGFYASLVTLPHRLTPDALVLRYGLLAEARIPYAAIASVERARRKAPKERDGLMLSRAGDTASFAIAGTTTLTLHLRTPIALQRLTGSASAVSTIHLTADDPDRLVRALRERIASPAAISIPTTLS